MTCCQRKTPQIIIYGSVCERQQIKVRGWEDLGVGGRVAVYCMCASLKYINSQYIKQPHARLSVVYLPIFDFLC
jgi:hypothetical protein